MFRQWFHQAAAFSQSDNERRLLRLLLPAIVVVTALLLLWQAWLFWQTWQFEPAISGQRQSSNTITYQTAPILQAELFGADQQTTASASLPETRLQLTLRGVFTANSDKLASAIIEDANGVTRSFKINSSVFGDSQLKAVYADRVVLSRNGALESLYFPSSLAPVTTSNNDTAAVPAVETTTAAPRQAIAGRKITPEQRQQLIRQRLQELRDRARQQRRQETAP